MKKVHDMTRKEIESFGKRREWDQKVECSSIVLIPLRGKHDSGYRLLDFLAVGENDQPLCLLSGCSDVIHIHGIGGMGDWNPGNGVPKSVPPLGWSIDCLAKSGLFRMWCNGSLTAGAALSSFSLYGKESRK